MSREAHIPLVLWISAAIVAHLAGGSGAVEVAKVYEDRAQFKAFVHAVRDGMRPADTTFEVLTDEVAPSPVEQASVAPDKQGEPSDEPSEPVTEPSPPPPVEVKPAPKPIETAVASATPPPPPRPPEPEKPAAAVPMVPTPATPPPPPPADHRIAVRQHVQPNQEDNPTANRIADDANHTNDETVARIRSHDQDAPDPTPGTHAGPKGEVGSSDESKVAHSEDKSGNEKHAPGEATPTSTASENHAPGSDERSPATKIGETAAAKPGVPKAPVAAAAPPAAAPPPSPGGAGPASPEVVSGDKPSWSLDPANPGGDGRSRSAGKRQAPSPYQGPSVRSMGLNAAGVPGHPNLNLTMNGVEAAVGDKQLKAERAADGAARRSKHRGSWETNKFERWRAAIENYEPSVKLGNQTSLNAARVPFATYINSIHNRLHPIFAEEFLASLDNLPSTHALNQELVTHVEIVLSKDEGRIVRLGVTKQSGATAFDVVALNSISRASPFGKAPDAIVSPDGSVYLHWEFHRDPYDACTTRNARPFLLKGPQTPGPPPLLPRKAPGTKPADERMSPLPLLPVRP